MRTTSLVARIVLLLPLLLRTGWTQTRENRPAIQSAPPQSAAADPMLARNSFATEITGARVQLGAGDLLEVRVFDVPELTQKARVDHDGKIALALIGEIEVRGLSPSDVEKVVTTKLADGHFVKQPEVSVFVVEYAGQVAYVTGEVNKPGAYSLLRSHKLMDLISVAGGFTPRAGNLISIHRQGEDSAELRFDLSEKDESRTNPEIQPGDRITVSESGIVYVLGEVERPGGFLLDRRKKLTVAQALALAEGNKPSAKLGSARLIRTVDDVRTEVPLDIRSILKSKSPDLELQAGDIIYLPGSLLRGMGRKSIETILATASGVAVYSSYHP